MIIIVVIIDVIDNSLLFYYIIIKITLSINNMFYYCYNCYHHLYHRRLRPRSKPPPSSRRCCSLGQPAPLPGAWDGVATSGVVLLPRRLALFPSSIEKGPCHLFPLAFAYCSHLPRYCTLMSVCSSFGDARLYPYIRTIFRNLCC